MTRPSISILPALLALLALAPLRGAETTASVELGADLKAGDYNNAKYNEYKNNDRALRTQGRAMLGLTDNENGLRFGLDLEGANVPVENMGTGAFDGALGINAEKEGLFKLGLELSRMGHNFVEGAVTPYDKGTAGSNRLILSDGALQALKGATAATITGRMGGVTGTSNTINLGLDRDRSKAELELFATEHSTIGLSAANEFRRGSRPLGQSFSGTSAAIELPEPIDYQTMDLGLDYAYRRDWVYSDLNYHHRSFVNNNSGLAFDNPYNAGGTNKNGVSVVSGGAVMAQVALAPSNTDDAFGADLMVDLPLKSRIEGTGSYATYQQNALFLPFTSNPASYAAATAAGAMVSPSAASLNGKVLNINGAVRLQSDPLPWVRVKAASEYQEHDNQSAAVQSDVGYKNADYNSAASVKVYPIYENWVEAKNSAGLRLKYGESSLGGSYWHSTKGITGGVSDGMIEDGGKMDFDSQSLAWLGWRVGAERSSRESNYYPLNTATTKALFPSNIAGSSGDLTLSRMYYQADRDRDAGSAQLNVVAGQYGSAVLGYTLAHDYYRNTIFGLLDDNDQTFNADADIQLGEWLSLNPSYTYEQHVGVQRSDGNLLVANLATPLSDPNAWTGSNFESIQTVGLAAGLTPYEGLLVNVGGAYSETHGQMGFNYNGLWVPNDIVLDQSHTLSLDAKASYRVSDALRIGAGYQYATFSYNNYLTDGQPSFNTNGGAAATPTRFLMVLDSQPVSYTVQTVVASAEVSF